MANNPYGLPPLPPMANNNASHQYQHQYLQQQHQSERISGDGEEVHRLGFRPVATGPPPQLLPPLGVGIPPTPQGPAGVGYNYESFNQIPLSGNFYDQYDYTTGQQQQLVQQNGVIDEGYPTVDNRSADGEEQHLQRYGNDPMSIQGMGMPPGPLMSLSSGIMNAGQLAPTSLGMINPPMTMLESHQPVGVEMPQQYQTLQQEQRSETIGSAAVDSLPLSMLTISEDDYQETGGNFVSIDQQLDNDPRSIEGQEFPDPELMDPNGSSPTAFVSSNPIISSLQGIPFGHENRSETIGSETQVEEDSRSIEGQEQVPNDFTIIGTGTAGGGHPSGPSQPPLQSSYQRSETLGSDTINDEPRGALKSKNVASKTKTLKSPLSGSETGDSVGRSTRDVDDRRRRKDDSANKVSRGKREGSVRQRHRSPSFEENDDSCEDEHYYRDQSRNESNRGRDYERDRTVRPHDKDRNRPIPDSRRGREDDWETSSNRHYNNNDRVDRDREPHRDRPRSRNSSHQYGPPDDYHRKNPSHYYDNHRPRNDYDYPRYRDRRGPPSTGYDPSSSMYGAPARNQFYSEHYAPAAPDPEQLRQRNYIDKLRHENPPVYKEWYIKYRAYMANPTLFPIPKLPGYVSVSAIKHAQMPKRPPSHSGRSSVAELSTQEESGFRPILDEPHNPSPPRRMTPQKFHTSHSFGTLTPTGQLIRIRNGGTVVELTNINSLMKKLPEYKEVQAFPGPLIKDITHKNTIVQFCERKKREVEFNDAQVDRENLILLWDLLILLLRHNGIFIGSDFAELLLKCKSVGQEVDKVVDRESSESGEDEPFSNTENAGRLDPRKEELYVKTFCEYLLHGDKKQALDFAMEKGLWGHALFFASKMGEKMYGNVLARFANGMNMNSPLQTLHQVLSGKQPASVTCCCDDSFGDWKPHLAMILSNGGQRPEVESKAIRTLGDTLGNRSHIFAAQFCYLMGNVEFSPDSPLGTLLGYNPSVKNLLEATQMTEIYEFAGTLANPNFSLGTSFIECKLNYVKTLIDLGFIQEAFLYCEELTKSLRKGTIHESERNVAWNILQIAERLVNCDDSADSVEPAWIEDLRRIADQLVSESTSRKLSSATASSDIATDIPLAINQPNQYPADIHPSALPPNALNAGSENQFSAGTPYVEPLPESNVDAYIQNQQQWNQPPMSLPYNATTLNNVHSIPQGTNSYLPEGNTLSNGPTSLPYDIGSSAPNIHSNNNYLYSNYGSTPSFGEGGVTQRHMQGPVGHVNEPYPKKKTVRFEDDELIANIVNVLENKQLGGLKNRMKHDIVTTSLQNSRSDFSSNSNCHDGLRQLNRPNMFKGFSEGESKSDHSFNDRSPAASPIKFKSTFPIDEPIGQSLSLKSNTDQRKAYTFPVDEKCCDLNEPCEEHDNYLNEKDSRNASFEDLIHDLEPEETEDTQYPEQRGSSKQSGENKSQKEQSDKKSKPLGGQKSGWLSGMFGKLLPKLPGQVHLPDDTDPAIIWDKVEQRWKPANGIEDEDAAPAGPPPSDRTLMGMGSSVPPSSTSVPPMQNVPPGNPMTPGVPQFTNPTSNGLPANPVANNFPQSTGINGNGSISNSIVPPPGLNAVNKYKRPKGISLRNNYVDVFNPGSPRKPQESNMPSTIAPSNGPGMPNIFIPNPAPVASDSAAPTNFLSSAPEPYPGSNEGNDQQGGPPAPQMFDPSQFQNQRNDYGVHR